MTNVIWLFDAVKDHISNEERVWQLLPLHTVDRLLQKFLILGRLRFFAYMINGSGQESTCSRRRVEYFLAKSRIYAVNYEPSDRTWGVELTSIPC